MNKPSTVPLSEAPSFYRDINPEDLPLPDGQVMQLVQYCSQDEVDMDTLARLIATNLTLTTQILRLANSPLFGFQRQIQSVSHAMVALGTKSLRSLVLCFAVQEALAKKDIPGFDAELFWEDTVRRGAAARLISEMIKGPTDESFTAGILLDVGLLVLFMAEPEKSDRWLLLRANDPDQRYQMEQDLFGITHDQVGSQMTESWQLPTAYSHAIREHHQPTHAEADGSDIKQSLTAIMTLCDWCNALFTCHNKAEVLITLKEKAATAFGLSGEDIETLLASLPDKVNETASAMSIAVGQQKKFEAVMEEANRKLVEDNICYQELTWQLQNTLKERDEYAAKLDKELNIAREIQQSLQPDTTLIAQVAAFNIPAQTLSGDFYDYFTLDDGSICFCLGDVSGKGTHAALLMAKAISLFRCLCKVDKDVVQIVELMNTELCDTATRGMFITFVAGWLEPTTQTLRIINAGHLPPLLISQNSLKQIEASGPPLGVVGTARYKLENFSLADSKLYLYTDGITEGRSISGEELGLKGFVRWLVQSKKLPIKAQLSWIEQQLQDTMAAQLDDLTLMILAGK